jgi:SAM-dependent methyltransferase
MIESSTPEVDVISLMERVRVKAEQMRRLQAQSKLPAVHDVGEFAVAILPKPAAPRSEQIMRATDTARRALAVSRWIPRPIRRLFRHQAAFDYELLRAVESIAQANAQFADRLRHLIACVEIQDHGIQRLASLRRADTQWMNAVAQVARVRDEETAWMQTAGRLIAAIAEGRDRFVALVNTIRGEVAALQAKDAANDERVTDILHRIDVVTETVKHQDQRIETVLQESAREREDIASCQRLLDTLTAHVTTVARHGEQTASQLNNLNAEQTTLRGDLGAATAGLSSVQAEFGSLRNALDNLGEQLRVLQAHTDQQVNAGTDWQRRLAQEDERANQLTMQMRTEAEERAAIRTDLRSLEQRHTTDSAFIKAELSRLSLALQKSIEALMAKSPALRKRRAAGALADTAGHQLDAFYFSFENRFRGPRAEIKNRIRYYVPFLLKCGVGSTDTPVLDLGCGRGEWLELLREKNLVASGVDINGSMIEQCRERRLKVAEGDALDFLCALPDNSQGAVTGFHIIEHLPLETVVRLLRETFRVLRPGGIAIFETPNCKNLVVGACNFYIDPTHRNPIFPETAQFMLESVGFEGVTLEYLSPVAPSDRPATNGESPHLQELLYGPRDFGVIGHKPGAG